MVKVLPNLRICDALITRLVPGLPLTLDVAIMKGSFISEEKTVSQLNLLGNSQES